MILQVMLGANGLDGVHLMASGRPASGADFGENVRADVAAGLGPFIVLFHQDRSGQADDGVRILVKLISAVRGDLGGCTPPGWPPESGYLLASFAWWYSSWRRNQLSGSAGPRASFRPRGARSSHWYMPQRPS